MAATCCWCEHYCQTSRLVTTGQLNVSGKLAKYRVWSKHRCSLKQEDKYPNKCNFEFDVKLWKEMEERYPDLALFHQRSTRVTARVKELHQLQIENAAST